MTGHIAALKPSQFVDGGGYGFIQSDDQAGGRLYFNSSGVQRTSVPFSSMKVGDPCYFTEIVHPDGPRAIEVLVASSFGQRGLPLPAAERELSTAEAIELVKGRLAERLRDPKP